MSRKTKKTSIPFSQLYDIKVKNVRSEMIAKNKAVLISFGGFHCKLRTSVCGVHLNFILCFPGAFGS